MWTNEKPAKPRIKNNEVKTPGVAGKKRKKVG
jgi:hypothetical protein